MKLECPLALEREGLLRAICNAVKPELEAVQREAKANCPKDTGALAESIVVRMHGSGGEVAALAPYAMHVEMGTAHQAARPFLYPTLSAHRQAIADCAARAAAAYLRDGRRTEATQ